MVEFEIRLTRIIDETHDTKTFVFDKPKGLEFIPGQYCLLRFQGDTAVKPFTFSSSPHDQHLAITVKNNL